ncbi:papain family cysteine protease, partial [Oesophagostomum dentatum]
SITDFSFDSREQWPQCTSISTIRDQSDCGSCWAFGAAEAISDRICIASNGKTNVAISSDDVLSCCGKTCGDGCDGGYPIEAWRYWVKHGICTGGSYESQSGCKPYTIPPCGHHVNQTYYGACPTDGYSTPVCTSTCIDGYSTSYTDDKHYGKSAYGVAKTVTGIQKEIMTNGPVEVAYTVYEDFYQYTSGVYVVSALCACLCVFICRG